MNEWTLTFAPAFTLGLLHSLEPSHAKAVLASYFLNRKRTFLEAVVFAVTVTIAHTLAIYALALVGFVLGPLLNHQSVERWSALSAGVVMMGIGGWLFWNERRAGFHREESAGCDHGHGHFFHHSDYHHDHPMPSSWRQIFVLGFCSGAIPCMSGVAVLLMAWTTGSKWLGLSLVGVFSLGLGLVVFAMCVATQQSARLMDRYWKKSAHWTRFLPIMSSVLILLIGVAVTLQAGVELLGTSGNPPPLSP